MCCDRRNSKLVTLILLVILTSACSRQQSDWKNARTVNTVESYEQFLKNYPVSEFAAQAKARVKELSQERDWQKARDLDTADAYQAFLKQYPDGKWTEEARIRIENFSIAQAPADDANGESAAPVAGSDLKQSTAAPPAADAAPADMPRSNEAPAHAPSRAPPPPAQLTPPPAKSGRYAVQLGAFGAGAAAAENGWRTLQKSQPSLLRGLKHRVVASSGTGAKVYRLQAVDLGQEQANSLCRALKAKAHACMVVP